MRAWRRRVPFLIVRWLTIAAVLSAAACLSAGVASASPHHLKIAVLCRDHFGDTFDAVKPKTCAFEDANLPHRIAMRSTGRRPRVATASAAGEFYVEDMRWRNWRSGHATATGTWAGNMDYRARATIRLSHLRRCTSLPEKVYTYFWIKIKGEEPIGYPLEGCD